MGTLVNTPVVDFYRNKKRWVVFRQEPDPKNPGERQKIPYCVWDLLELLKHLESYPDPFEVARKGNPDNWRTWGALFQVNLCLQRWPELLPAVMILPSDSLILIDLDVHKTKDPVILGQCYEVYEKCDSFTQQSVNGGLHVWVRASIPGNRDGEGLHIEMYNKHFATVTLYPAYPDGTWTDNHKLLAERQAEADWIFNLIPALRNGHKPHQVKSASKKVLPQLFPRTSRLPPLLNCLLPNKHQCWKQQSI
jgi:hypothetical protein